MTQREAAEWRRRAMRAERLIKHLRMHWTNAWPEKSIFLGRVETTPEKIAIIETAKRLRHAVVVSTDGNNAINLWADPVEAEK